jgi:hypothetical protein
MSTITLEIQNFNPIKPDKLEIVAPPWDTFTPMLLSLLDLQTTQLLPLS